MSRSTAPPPLLPTPRRIEPRPGRFRLRDGLPLVLPPYASDRDFASASRLRDAILERTGRRLEIEGHGSTADLRPCIELRADADPATLRTARDLEPGLAPELQAQGYRIAIDADAVLLSAPGSDGLRHGVETLIQLIDMRGFLHACCIDDAPRLALRGIMLDVSRGKVPTIASLEALVDLCARLKLNVLMLYTEHTFRFRRHPEIGRHDSPLDAETMRRLDAYAALHGVDLVPTLQSLGHMEHVLALPAYAALAETDLGWTVAPVAPGTRELLRDLYDDYLPNFRSAYFNANCDEPWDLGRGQSSARAEELGPGGVYLEHVHWLREQAERHGKRMMLWGDVVHGHPARIPELDRRLILLDWWYEADFDFDRVEIFARNDLEFLVCPGTSSWNSLFPRVENSRLNISRWAEAGRRHGARGLINTDWGDGGHYNLQGNSYFAYAWGAQESWNGPCAAKTFDRAFSRCLFGDSKGEIAGLYRSLGRVHDPGFSMFNGSAIQNLFFDSIESAYFVGACKPSKLHHALSRLDDIRRRAQRVRARLDLQGDAALTLDELVHALDASEVALQKGLAGLEYLAWRREPDRLRAGGRRQLARRLGALADAQAALARRLRRLWLKRAAPSNFEITRKRFGRSVKALRAGARSLRENRPRPAPAPRPFDRDGVLAAVRESFGRDAG